MIDPIRNAIEPTQTGQAEFGATYWSSLRNGSREKTNRDCSSKGCGSTDPAQESVFDLKMIGWSGRAFGMLFWRQREFWTWPGLVEGEISDELPEYRSRSKRRAMSLPRDAQRGESLVHLWIQ